MNIRCLLVDEGMDTYFQVNSASPVSTARVILSSHNVASSGGSGSKLDVEKPSSSSKKLSSTFVRSAADVMSGLYAQVAGV